MIWKQHPIQEKRLLVKDVDTSYLMVWNKIGGSEWFNVEDNLVNRLVIGKPLLTANQLQQINVSLTPHLFPYQHEDVKKLCSLTNSLNANTMGLGKTIEMIDILKQNDLRTEVLILCPKSVVYQWYYKLLEWWPEIADNLEVFPRKIKRGKIYILNYELAATPKMNELFRNFLWKAMVCDESHKIKNPNAHRTAVIKAIPSVRRFALSGTPILRRPNDLWSQLHWLDWSYSGTSLRSFERYFCSFDDKTGQAITGLTKDHVKQSILNSILNTVSVRNPATSYGQLIEDVVPLKLSGAQQRLYLHTRNLIFKELPEDMTIPNGAVLLTRLLQVTSNPTQWQEGSNDVKAEWIEDFLEMNPDRKVLIFTRFARTATDLAARLKCPAHVGDMSSLERVTALRRFKTTNQALVGTIGSMGLGIDGLQDACHTAVFIERDWSPSVVDQAIGRLYRTGQKEPVSVFYLDCRGTVDKYVGKVNASKREDIMLCLGDDDS